MGRAPCCDKANVKRGPWSPEEDAMLKNFVEKYGTGGNWIALPRKAGLKRCGKSCRLRWLNYLRPDIKHGGFSEEEDNIICRLYANIGSRWSIIAAQLPGRTDNDIKNYWNTKLKKKILAKTSTSQNNNKDDNERHQIISNSHQNLMVSSSNKRQQDLLGMPEMRSSSDPQQNQNVNRSSASHMPVSSFSHPNHHLSGSSTDSKSLNSTQIYEDQQQHNTHTQIQIFQESGRKMQQPDQYLSFTSMLMRFQPQKTEDSSDCSTNLAPPIMANSNASASAAALNGQDHQLYMAMNQSTVKQEPGVENGNNHNHHGILVPMIAPYWDTAAAGNYQSLLMEAMADAANNNGSSGSNLALSYVLSEDHASSYNNSSTAEEAPRFCTYLQLPVSATTATTTTTTDNSNAFGSSSAYVPSAGASSSNLSFRHHSSYQYIMAGEAATTTTTAPTTTTNKQVLFQNEFRPSLENNVFCA